MGSISYRFKGIYQQGRCNHYDARIGVRVEWVETFARCTLRLFSRSQHRVIDIRYSVLEVPPDARCTMRCNSRRAQVTIRINPI